LALWLRIIQIPAYILTDKNAARLCLARETMKAVAGGVQERILA
jgi:hypothetical protein